MVFRLHIILLQLKGALSLMAFGTKRVPNDLTLRAVSLDEVENDLGLKGSILDRLDHVVGEVKGEESLVELEPIVNCANLRLRFVKSFVSPLVS